MRDSFPANLNRIVSAVCCIVSLHTLRGGWKLSSNVFSNGIGNTVTTYVQFHFLKMDTANVVRRDACATACCDCDVISHV